MAKVNVPYRVTKWKNHTNNIYSLLIYVNNEKKEMLKSYPKFLSGPGRDTFVKNHLVELNIFNPGVKSKVEELVINFVKNNPSVKLYYPMTLSYLYDHNGLNNNYFFSRTVVGQKEKYCANIYTDDRFECYPEIKKEEIKYAIVKSGFGAAYEMYINGTRIENREDIELYNHLMGCNRSRFFYDSPEIKEFSYLSDGKYEMHFRKEDKELCFENARDLGIVI